jgi:ribonuclease E
MTRQRIRPSVLDSHYNGCLHCDGRGLVKSSEEVAADATRHSGWLLHLKKVKRVEITCSPSVGSYLLSNNRSELDSHEKRAKKRIVVRISEGIATDRVSYYAYDERGADIDLTAIPPIEVPAIKELQEASHETPETTETKPPRKRQRSRRRGRAKSPIADATSISEDDKQQKPRNTRRNTRKKVERKSTKLSNKSSTPAESATRVYQIAKLVGKTSKEIIEFCKKKGADVRGHMSTVPAELVTAIHDCDKKSQPKKRKSGRSRKNTRSSGGRKSQKKVARNKSKKKRPSRQSKKVQKPNEVVEEKTPAAKPRRTLYGGRHRTVSAEEVQQSRVDR